MDLLSSRRRPSFDPDGLIPIRYISGSLRPLRELGHSERRLGWNEFVHFAAAVRAGGVHHRSCRVLAVLQRHLHAFPRHGHAQSECLWLSANHDYDYSTARYHDDYDHHNNSTTRYHDDYDHHNNDNNFNNDDDHSTTGTGTRVHNPIPQLSWGRS